MNNYVKCCSETLKSLPGSRQKNTYILSGADSLSTLLSLSSLFTTNRICIRAAQPSEPCSSRPLSLSLSHRGDVTFGHSSVRSGVPGSQGALWPHKTHLCAPPGKQGKSSGIVRIVQFRHVQEIPARSRCFQSHSRLS